MHRRSLLLLLAALIALFAATAAAAPRDAAANKKIDEAINTHYLATDFDKAEAVLTGTINACGNKCSGPVIARAWMYVGIVRGSGKNDQKGAKEAFQKAVAADGKVALDDALATPETKKTFGEVSGGAPVATGGTGGEGGEGGEGGKAPAAGNPVGEMTCEPAITQIETRRPFPISCTTDEDAVKGELRYKEFGGESWKTLKMTKKGDAFQAEMPCTATALAGKLRFYVRAQDASGDTVDTYGNKSNPVEIDVVGKTDQEPPAFPDKDAPARCKEQEECPPDFPGCKRSGGGTKGWGASCASTDECESGSLVEKAPVSRSRPATWTPTARVAASARAASARKARAVRTRRTGSACTSPTTWPSSAAAMSAPRTASRTTALPAFIRAVKTNTISTLNRDRPTRSAPALLPERSASWSRSTAC